MEVHRVKLACPKDLTSYNLAIDHFYLRLLSGMKKNAVMRIHGSKIGVSDMSEGSFHAIIESLFRIVSRDPNRLTIHESDCLERVHDFSVFFGWRSG